MSSIYTEGPDPAIYYSKPEIKSCRSHVCSACGLHMYANIRQNFAFSYTVQL